MLDWAAHLKHLQSILVEYDPIKALNKHTILKYFKKSLKPFILTKLEYQNLELKSFDQMIEKTIHAEAKPAFWPRSGIWEIDQHCSRGNQPANSTIAKLQGTSIKDRWTEKPKVHRPKSFSAYHHSNNKCSNGESPEKACKEKKKERRCQKQW